MYFYFIIFYAYSYFFSLILFGINPFLFFWFLKLDALVVEIQHFFTFKVNSSYLETDLPTFWSPKAPYLILSWECNIYLIFPFCLWPLHVCGVLDFFMYVAFPCMCIKTSDLLKVDHSSLCMLYFYPEFYFIHFILDFYLKLIIVILNILSLFVLMYSHIYQFLCFPFSFTSWCLLLDSVFFFQQYSF